MRTLLILVALVFTGCTSELVRRQYQPERGGIVRYLNEGAGYVISQRRQHGFELAKEFCGGTNPEFLGESDVEQNNGSTISRGFTPNTLMTTNNNSTYTYMQFRCEKPAPRLPSTSNVSGSQNAEDSSGR